MQQLQSSLLGRQRPPNHKVSIHHGENSTDFIWCRAGEGRARRLVALCGVQPDPLHRNGFLNDSEHCTDIWLQFARVLKNGCHCWMIGVDSIPHTAREMLRHPSLYNGVTANSGTHGLPAVGEYPARTRTGVVGQSRQSFPYA